MEEEDREDEERTKELLRNGREGRQREERRLKGWRERKIEREGKGGREGEREGWECLLCQYREPEKSNDSR